MSEVSLDDELLQVTASAPKKSNNKVQKKSKQDRSPRDDDGGEASGSDSDSDHRNGKRKPKAESKKPLKKRKTDSSDDESSEDDVYRDEWDDELYGDSADRQALNAMPMIEREEILSNRYAQRKQMRDEWLVKRRLKQEQREKEKREKKDSGEKRDRGVSSGKKLESKSKALSELKKKRAKAGYRKSDSEEEAEDAEVDEAKDDDDDADYAPKKKSGSADYDSGKGKDKDTDKDKDKDEEDVVFHNFSDDEGEGHPLKFDEVEQIRLTRIRLEKWVDKPFFTKLVPGFFVRIGIGMDPATRMNVYRLAQIDSVVSKTAYPLAGKPTTKWLRLLIGDKAKEFKMETISNNPFSQSEFLHWEMQMKNSSRSMPTSADIPKKLETLRMAEDYQYTSDDIEKMLAEKKSAGSLPIKLSAEKARLGILRDTTTDPDKKADLERQIARLEELGKERDKNKKKTASVLNINQRNKETNFVTTLETKAEDKSTSSDLDPFSRRRTLPRIVYASKHKEEDPNASTPTPTPAAPTPAPAPAVSNGNANGNANGNGTANPLKGSTGSAPPKTSEHDSIDIDIPLAPSSTSAPPARLYPTAPAPTTPPFVPPEKKTKSTLSLDDYMRRRRAME